MNDKLKKYIQDLESEFVYPKYINLVMDLNRTLAFKRLEKLPESQRSALEQVPVVILPNQEINAMAYHSGNYFVMINMGLIVFIEVFSSLFLDDLMLVKTKEEVISKEKSQVLVNSISLLLGDCLGIEKKSSELMKQLEKTLKKKKIKIQKNRSELMLYFQASLVGWFIGHEYGHIVRGHMGGAMKSIKLSSSSRYIDMIDRNSQQQEFEADEFGLEFMSSTINKEYKGQSLFDIFLLSSADICTSLIRLIEYGMQLSDHWTMRHFEHGFGKNFAKYAHDEMKKSKLSHPRAKLRNERIRKLGSAQENKSVLTLANNVQLIIEETMNMMHDGTVSLEPLRSVVLTNIDNLPDEIMCRAFDMD